MAKNCARRLEYGPRPKAERAVLKTRGTVFSHTDRPSQVNNMFIFSCSKLVLQITNGFVHPTLVFECLESACAPSTKHWFSLATES